MLARPKLGALANEFASTFGIFEYALKACKHYDVKQSGMIKTSWAKFVQANPQINQALFDRFKKDKIADTIISGPPKKLGEHGGKLGWLKPDDVVDMKTLYDAVSRIRNNLFHGDKSDWNDSRDPQLVAEALAVIRAIVAEAPNVEKAFNSGAMAFQAQLQ